MNKHEKKTTIDRSLVAFVKQQDTYKQPRSSEENNISLFFFIFLSDTSAIKILQCYFNRDFLTRYRVTVTRLLKIQGYVRFLFQILGGI